MSFTNDKKCACKKVIESISSIESMETFLDRSTADRENVFETCQKLVRFSSCIEFKKRSPVVFLIVLEVSQTDMWRHERNTFAYIST